MRRKHTLSFFIALLIEFLGWFILMLAMKPNRSLAFAEVTKDEWLALCLAIVTGILGWTNAIIINS